MRYAVRIRSLQLAREDCENSVQIMRKISNFNELEKSDDQLKESVKNISKSVSTHEIKKKSNGLIDQNRTRNRYSDI